MLTLLVGDQMVDTCLLTLRPAQEGAGHSHPHCAGVEPGDEGQGPSRGDANMPAPAGGPGQGVACLPQPPSHKKPRSLARVLPSRQRCPGGLVNSIKKTYGSWGLRAPLGTEAGFFLPGGQPEAQQLGC